MTSDVVGWIILSICLTIGLVIFLIMWAIEINKSSTEVRNLCFGFYGVEANVDGVTVNNCGTSRQDPCIFSKNTLGDAINECDNLRSICNNFTFSYNTSTMKIIDLNTTFISSGVNLYVRQ